MIQNFFLWSLVLSWQLLHWFNVNLNLVILSEVLKFDPGKYFSVLLKRNNFLSKSIFSKNSESKYIQSWPSWLNCVYLKTKFNINILKHVFFYYLPNKLSYQRRRIPWFAMLTLRDLLATKSRESPLERTRNQHIRKSYWNLTSTEKSWKWESL